MAKNCDSGMEMSEGKIPMKGNFKSPIKKVALGTKGFGKKLPKMNAKKIAVKKPNNYFFGS